MKLSIYTSLFCIAAVASSSAALYTSNFNSFTAPPSEIAGQDGWVINDAGTTGPLSYVSSLSSSQALGLGGAFGETTTSSVALSHSFVESVGRVSAQFDFSFEDSTDGPPFSARDTFSFSFDGSSGRLFEVSFVPQAQSSTPSSTTAKWDAFYSVSGGSPVSLAIIDLEEAGAYTFELTLGGAFTPSTTTSSYNIKIGSGATILERNGSIALNPQLVTTGFAFNYTPTNGATLNGTNSLLVDNLTVVPEPSSSLLLALTSLGLITRRRRA